MVVKASMDAIKRMARTRIGELPTEPSLSWRRRIDLGDVPPSFAFYAIGDVHGCLDLLVEAEEKIERDVARRDTPGLVLLLGDYVDRGPNSAGVLAHLLTPPPKGCRRLALSGNHEAAFLSFYRDPLAHLQWLDFGGKETMKSYGLDCEYYFTRWGRDTRELVRAMNTAIPESHIRLLESLPIYLRSKGIVFVHAGLRPGISLSSQTDDDMLWIREPFLSEGPKLPLLVVHGHTPSDNLQIGPNRIGIDTAAFATGKLTVLRVKDDRVRVL